ncbi:hypothetical protein E2C01_056213 [Portunus trituberculatus]|uniref:Uncharacterized protein n=1 Tax=Portunus trituberculatus TaxID=210409 RepID=A0A5B7GPT1_PORTR|nr:hypothetical protein [Portunus trituberculatus]
MDYSTAIFTSIGFLCIVTLGFACRYLVKFCRREQARLSSTSKQSGSPDSTFKEAQGVAATPQLCSYKKRFLASMPSLDRFLCTTLNWHEGVTLESGLGNLSFNRQGPGKQSGDMDARKEENNNDDDDAHKMENGRMNSISQDGGKTASPHSSSRRDNNSTRNTAHSILNLVSAIPNITLGSICHSQSLPDVNSRLAESVSTSTFSRDVVVLWSTTLESVNSGVLSSTHVE